MTAQLWHSCDVPTAQAVVSAALLVLPTATSVLRKTVIPRRVSRLLSPYLTLDELYSALAYSPATNDAAPAQQRTRERPSLGSTVPVGLFLIAALQAAVHLAFVGWSIASCNSSMPAARHRMCLQPVWTHVLLAVVWLYAALIPLILERARGTVRPSLVLLYLINAVASGLGIFSSLAWQSEFPTIVNLYGIAFHGYSFASDVLLLGLSLSLPLVIVPEAFTSENAQQIVRQGGVGSSPEDWVSGWSWISFSWCQPLIDRGRNGTLNESDIYDLSPTSRAAPLFAKFGTTTSNSILMRCFISNAQDLLIEAVLMVISISCNYASPYFMQRILVALSDPTGEALSSGFVFSTLAFISTLVKAQSDVNHLWLSRRAGVRVKSELHSALYEKALKRRDASGVGEGKGVAGVGKIINLMAGDTNRISEQVCNLYQAYGAPIEVIVCLWFLFSLLSWSSLVGFAALVLSLPLNHFLSSRTVVIQKLLLAARDKRLNLMTELIDSIKLIKAYAWERHWKAQITAARDDELRVMIRDRVNGTLFTILWVLTPMLVTVTTFACFVTLQGEELTTAVAFTALSLFTMLRNPLNMIPTLFVSVLQTYVAAKRIDDFLQENEVPSFVSTLKSTEKLSSPGTSEDQDSRIGFLDASFTWNAGAAGPASEGEASIFKLQDIDFLFPSGSLTVITGQTGSGKSALLSALLGEMSFEKGHVFLPKDTSHVGEDGLTNSIAVCTQRAWLQNGSIKNNILFGTKFDEQRYTAVVSACCLLPDFKQLEDGDETEIGSKGVSLSGGQKARVALARAIYSRAKNVLLDDPLAAVDSHTAAALVSDCLGGPLLKGRTVIIVSHHIELLLPITHSLIRIAHGRIEASGTVEALRKTGGLSSIITDDLTSPSKEKVNITGPVQDADGVASALAANSDSQPTKRARKMVQDEARAVGNVSWTVYKLYLAASSWWIWAAILFLILLSQFNAQLERVWLKEWTRASEETSRLGFNLVRQVPAALLLNQSLSNQFIISAGSAFEVSSSSDNLYYLSIYALITLLSASVFVILTVVSYVGAYWASKTLHERMLGSVTRSTLRWFDTTPSGRIVNRFSRDQATVDDQLSHSIRSVVWWASSLLVSIVVIIAIVPRFALPAALISWVFARLSVAYVRCGRDLRRIEANARSPIISGFQECLEGITTIRAWGQEARFLRDFQSDLDKSLSCYWWTWMLNRWLLLRFDCLGGFSVFLTSLLVLVQRTDAGSGGMAILSAQSFFFSMYWLCRSWSQLEMDLNSIERVEEYLQLPQEPSAIIESNRPPAYWPSSSGQSLISVEELVVAYSPELPPVIHGVSFDIKPKEKIGLIGRTGSGKSTLGMSLLRFTDPISGRIIIDGIDITKIGLEDLRSRVTIIPQDAILFSGTIRENLDPFKEHTDDELLDALQRAQLGPSTPSAGPSRVASGSNLVSLDDGAAPVADAEDVLKANSIVVSVKKVSITLESEVAAGGSNFSQGQRQLLAMARALLRNSSIIIMDESTASVDMETDSLLQKMIREEFKDSCLITIAHRLSSIIDYDRLLVLDHGRLVEFATPYELLTKPEGEDAVFAGMVRKSGKWNELFESAKCKAQNQPT